MKKFIVIGTISLLIFSFVTLCVSINSIKCFQCNSGSDPLCADLTVNDTKSIFYQPCIGHYNGSTPFCRKYVTNLLHVKEEKDAIRVHRSCGWLNSKNITKDICVKEDSDFIKKRTCTCFSDGCNSTGQIVSSTFLTFSFFVIVYLFN